MNEWQPIETAPKDGTMIDLWCISLDGGHGYREPNAYWHGGQKRGRWWAPNNDYDGCDGQIRDIPVYWMPLPEPPKE